LSAPTHRKWNCIGKGRSPDTGGYCGCFHHQWVPTRCFARPVAAVVAAARRSLVGVCRGNVARGNFQHPWNEEVEYQDSAVSRPTEDDPASARRHAMKVTQCVRENHVVEAIISGCAPNEFDFELRTHVQSCAVCS